MVLDALPFERTSFVGRTADLERLDSLFAAGARLVTILGPAGMGKTRLAARFCRLRGSLFCDLGPARDADAICAALMAALGLPPPSTELRTGAGAGRDRLGRAMAGRGPILMVLDNFEQAVDHAPATVGRWLALAPAARFLVTSRERLRLSGEEVHELLPLATGEAEQLFLERASAVRPGFSLAPGVMEIVHRLEGIPLAIELAAARMGVLGPADLLDRMAQRLDLLGGGPRDAEARQATLRNAIDGSWELLTPGEQAAFAQCSVFEGGFTLDAAEAVADLGERALDVVQALKDKSLLRMIEMPGGGARFDMYESLRAYAAEKLQASGRAQILRQRHAAFFARAGVEWGIERLVLERENLRYALETSLAAVPRTTESATRALEAALALCPVLATRGPFTAQIAWLSEALEAARPLAIAPPLLARAFDARGDALRAAGRFAEALGDFERALALAREAGDRRTEGLALHHSGTARHWMGRPDRAQADFEAAMTIFRAIGDRRGQAICQGSLGNIRAEMGRHAEAQIFYGEALRLARRCGDRRLEATSLLNLGLVDQERRQTSRARSCQGRARILARELGDRGMEGLCHALLALSLHDQGDLAQARAGYETALADLREVGDLANEAIYAGALGLVYEEEGRPAEAAQRYQAALASLEEAHAPRDEAIMLARLAGAEAAQGNVALAGRLLERAGPLLAGGDAIGAGILGLRRAHLDLALAGQSAGAPEARGRIEEARAVVAAAQRGGGEALSARSAEVRITLRILDRALWPAVPQDQLILEGVDAAPPQALVVHVEGRWFWPPGRRRMVALGRRRAPRLILWKLAVQRLEARGKGLSPDELLAAGWPGERVLPEAAANRVRVALATLRSMGLRDLILTRDDGYLLDPEVPLLLGRNARRS